MKKTIFIICAIICFSTTPTLAIANTEQLYIERGNSLFQEYIRTKNEHSLDEAYKNYFKAIEIAPSSSGFLGMGMVLLEKKLYPQAKTYLYRAYSIDENDAVSNYYLAKFSTHKQEYTKAIDFYIKAYNGGLSENYDINNSLGVLYEKVGDLEKAKTHFEKAYKLNPSDTTIKNKIASIQILERNKEKYPAN